MIVRMRNNDLSYKRDIKQDKVDIILRWLLEFRFSSREILADLLGLKVSSCRRFFSSLESEGVLQKFSNVHTKGYTYYMLSATSVSYLRADGLDVDKAVVRSDRMGRYSTIIHDLAVQESALALIRKFDCSEVIWDRNIEAEGERPDLVFKTSQGSWAALEYERWRKKERQIYRIFHFHAQQIRSGKYGAVLYQFSESADMAVYEKLFSAEEWPKFTKAKGRLKESSEKFRPEPVVRERFKFEHRPSILQ